MDSREWEEALCAAVGGLWLKGLEWGGSPLAREGLGASPTRSCQLASSIALSSSRSVASCTEGIVELGSACFLVFPSLWFVGSFPVF